MLKAVNCGTGVRTMYCEYHYDKSSRYNGLLGLHESNLRDLYEIEQTMINFTKKNDNATKSGTVKGEASPLTYEEARKLAEKYVNDRDISLDTDKTPVTYKGKQAYVSKLYSRSMAANGGSGFMGMAVFVYTDNSGIESAEAN